LYRDALKLAPSDDDRRRIIATVEGFLAGFVDAMAPVVNNINNVSSVDLQEALNASATVVRESDGRPIPSGSNGQ